MRGSERCRQISASVRRGQQPAKRCFVRLILVLTDTGDFYRFFDATPHAEFLYACVEKTIEHDLPAQTEFLRRYDKFKQDIENFIDMPDGTIDLLFRFLHQNSGRLSGRAREKEFRELTDQESERVERVYQENFMVKET